LRELVTQDAHAESIKTGRAEHAMVGEGVGHAPCYATDD
jgi:hypothetical protein